MNKQAAASAILVVGPSWVGDMVMAQALFMHLRERQPQAAIDVLAPGWSLPVIARMPEVRNGIELPFAHGELNLAARRRLGIALRAAHYDQAIVLPNSWKSALVPFFARIPRRTGYRREFRHGLLNDLRLLDREQLGTTVQQFVALAEDEAPAVAPKIPQPRLRIDPARGAQLRADLGLPQGPAVALMPGAEYGPAKQWPAESYGALAKLLAARGIHSWTFGSAKEKQLGEQIAYASEGAAISLAGRTGLVDVIDLLGTCQAAVSNDSGLMHVAAAVGTPLVAIYGSSSPTHTPPLSDAAQILYLGLSCSPCFARSCPLGHLNCLRGIAPQMVLDKLQSALTA
ncbi:MAG: rfaF [Nevskia sp.]|nr:rfaF [Nevskia sp.]